MVYKGLCLSGGGVAGFVHLGVIKYLEEKYMTKNIDIVVCTSIGAVIGLLFSVGISSNEVYDLLLNIDHDMLQYSKIEQFFTVFGMDSGEYFMAQLADILLSKSISPLITFADILSMYGRHLVVTGTNVSKHKCTYFSVSNFPAMRVLDAIRISISIPFLLTATMYQNDLYVDGGITDNYPLHYCLEYVSKTHPKLLNVENHVVGSYIESMSPKGITNIEDYIYGIFACCLKRVKDVILPCTIFIKMEDVSSIEFNADKTKREKMLHCGYSAAKDYLDKLWFKHDNREDTKRSFYINNEERTTL